jgi:YHS domain-containing protein
MAKDPVCGMEVDEKKAAAKSEHMGKTFYFCAVGCKNAFDASPAKYTGGAGHGTSGHGGHKM